MSESLEIMHTNLRGPFPNPFLVALSILFLL